MRLRLKSYPQMSHARPSQTTLVSRRSQTRRTKFENVARSFSLRSRRPIGGLGSTRALIRFQPAHIQNLQIVPSFRCGATAITARTRAQNGNVVATCSTAALLATGAALHLRKCVASRGRLTHRSSRRAVVRCELLQDLLDATRLAMQEGLTFAHFQASSATSWKHADGRGCNHSTPRQSSARRSRAPTTPDA